MKYISFTTPGAIISLSIFDSEGSPVQAHAIIKSSIPGFTFAAQLCGISAATVEVIARIEEITGKHVYPVFRRFFLSDPANQAALTGTSADCAVNIIGQSPLDSTKVAQWIWLQEDTLCRNLGDGLWGDNHGRLWQGDSDRSQPGDSASLTSRMLESFCKAVNVRGGDFAKHCLRTWFFVRDVDTNYAGMVKARNKFFDSIGLNSATHFIASTGIGGSSPDTGQTITFNAFADMTLDYSDITYLKGSTHLNPTAEYGVAFERATAVDYQRRREIFVSGTASIDNRGNIVAPGDILAQTMRMLENIEVLLNEGGCSLDDLAHLIIYLRDAADFDNVDSFFKSQLPDVPRIIVLAPVCRPGWLIETECMALKAR